MVVKKTTERRIYIAIKKTQKKAVEHRLWKTSVLYYMYMAYFLSWRKFDFCLRNNSIGANLAITAIVTTAPELRTKPLSQLSIG